MKYSFFVFALVLCSGCDTDDDGGTTGGAIQSNGTVTDEWSDFCTATFTAPYTVLTFFDEPDFTIQAGHSFLVAYFYDAREEFHLDLLYVTDSGSADLRVTADSIEALPVTMNCAPGEVSSYLGVFATRTFYLDEALTQEACTLESGTYLRDMLGSGANLVSGTLLSNPVYRMTMGSMASLCNDHEITYVKAAQVPMGQSRGTYPPISSFFGPKSDVVDGPDG